MSAMTGILSAGAAVIVGVAIIILLGIAADIVLAVFVKSPFFL